MRRWGASRQSSRGRSHPRRLLGLLTHDRRRRLAVLDAARSRRGRRQEGTIAAPADGLLAPRVSALLAHSTADRKAPIREGPAFGCPVITLGSRVQRPEYGIDTGNRLVNRGTLAAPGPLRRLVGLTQTRSLLRLAAQPYGFHFVGDRLALRQAVAGCRWRTGRRDMHFALIARAGMVPECPTVRPLALVDGRNRRSGTKVCGSSQRRWWAA